MKSKLITPAKLKELAALQPLHYFIKYESILISNLLAELHKANREKNRPGDYYMTYQIMCEVYVKPALLNMWFLGDIIRVKKEFKIKPMYRKSKNYGN